MQADGMGEGEDSGSFAVMDGNILLGKRERKGPNSLHYACRCTRGDGMTFLKLLQFFVVIEFASCLISKYSETCL